MNFQQLRIIRETARRNFNLTEVANTLLTSQSGVSKHVKDLEDELGIELFVRRGKRLLGLTDAGREAVEIVERMLLDAENLSQIADRLSTGDQGALKIATTHTQARYTLPPIISKFKKAFPQVSLALHQVSPKEIASILLDGEIDIGIATDTLDDNPRLITFPFRSWGHAVIVPKDHKLDRVERLTLEAIAGWPIVTYDKGLTGRMRIDDAFASAGLTPQIAISALDADVIKAYVELGLGIGIIASIAFDKKRDAGLRMLDCSHLFARSTSRLAVRRGRYLRRYVYGFIALCSPDLTEKVVRAALHPPAEPRPLVHCRERA
jgi:LysR family transcriptional regulator, cys regulon transcriptional activator